MIIGNFLDNALQAVEKLPSPLRKILVLLKYDKGRLFIKVENSFDGKVKKKDGHIETMKSEIGHGYGLKKMWKELLKNMRAVCNTRMMLICFKRSVCCMSKKMF